jgi:hypothetical protein
MLATLCALCEQIVGQLIILFDTLVFLYHCVFLYYFAFLPLSPACAACHQKVSTVVLPCGRCRYCPTCLNDRIIACCTNRDSWPIYCCSVEQVSLRFVKHALPEDTIVLVRRRVAEWGRGESVHLYCANEECLVPPPSSNTQFVTCGECGGQTCRRCKNAGHDGTCRRDVGTLT